MTICMVFFRFVHFSLIELDPHFAQEGLMPEITTAVLERVAPPLNIDDNLG